jgi:hypothetical protein
MFLNIFVIFCITLFQGLNVYASRGWYVSVGGVSAKQDHDISNYSRTQSVNIVQQSSVQVAQSIPSSNVYWFAQDANNQDIPFQTYSSFATLQNALKSSYIINNPFSKIIYNHLSLKRISKQVHISFSIIYIYKIFYN